jgi:uncharacterized membrane protein
MLKAPHMTSLFRTTLVEAPFSSVIEYVRDFFDERPHLLVKAIASTNIGVETQRELIDDKADAVRRHDALSISWQPRWSVFPSFRGRATVRPQSPGAILALEGSYEPPGGLAGKFFDRLIGERLANGTMDHLLDRLRRYIEQRHLAFQQACPTIEQLNEVERPARSEKHG